MKELYERLPKNVQWQLEAFKMAYQDDPRHRELIAAKVQAYAKGLRDAGLINDHERGMLCVYCSTFGFNK